jgi:hypothetical protein
MLGYIFTPPGVVWLLAGFKNCDSFGFYAPLRSSASVSVHSSVKKTADVST